MLVLAVISLLSPLCTGVSPDSTGLVGTPYYYDMAGRYPAPKFWANPRDSALKPRKRDRDPHLLMLRMGSDFDPRWMRRTKREDKLMNISSSSLETRAAEIDERRPSVAALWEAALALEPPTTWPSPPSSVSENIVLDKEPPAAWLVALGSCSTKHEWRDLGIFFWPRLVRRVECERPANFKPGSASTASCGWPPGRMTCASGLTKTLQLLRWHCRLRNSVSEVFKRLTQAVNSGIAKPASTARKPRKRYRCDWVKVPYPVPADCQCGGF